MKLFLANLIGRIKHEASAVEASRMIIRTFNKLPIFCAKDDEFHEQTIEEHKIHIKEALDAIKFYSALYKKYVKDYPDFKPAIHYEYWEGVKKIYDSKNL